MADDLDPAAVERAARAIHANSFGAAAPWEHLTPAIRGSFETQARAALAAAGPLARPEHDARGGTGVAGGG